MIRSGLFHKAHSKRKYDNDIAYVEYSETKSNLSLVSISSSAMVSVSCNEDHIKNKDYNVASDIYHAETK